MKKHAENGEEQKIGKDTGGEIPVADKVTGVTDKSSAGADDAGEEKPAGEASQTAAQMPDLSVRIAELEKMNSDLNDQFLRKAADFDNYRKRMIKEKQEAIEYANTNLLIDLVQVLDDFDRAIASLGMHEAGTQGAAFTDGITMIRTQMGNMLETKYGLSYYAVKGEAFDPHIHEAIGSIPSADFTDPTVMEEFVKGYKLRDRVIRSAKVMVSAPVESEKE